MTARARPIVLFILTFFAIVFSPHEARAQGNEHPNPDSLSQRGDIKNLPAPLKQRIIDLARRPHTFLPLTVFCGSAHAEPALRLLPARHESFPAERVHRDHPRDQRRRDSDRRQLRQSRLADARLGSPGGRAEAGPADRPQRPGRVHRHLHRHLRPLRHQQRIGLVRRVDDPRPGSAFRRRSPSRRARSVRNDHRCGRHDGRRLGQPSQRRARASSSRPTATPSASRAREITFPTINRTSSRSS